MYQNLLCVFMIKCKKQTIVDTAWCRHVLTVKHPVYDAARRTTSHHRTTFLDVEKWKRFQRFDFTFSGRLTKKSF